MPEKIQVNNDDINFTNLNRTINNSIEKNNQINFIEINETLNNYSTRLNNIKDESDNLVYEKINNFLPKNSDNNKRKKILNKKINIQIQNIHNSISEFNTNLKEVRFKDTNKFTLINNSNINDKEKRENSKLKNKDKTLETNNKKIKNYININNVNIYRNNNNFIYRKAFKDSSSKLISKAKDNINDKFSKYLSKEIIYSRIFENYNVSKRRIINNHNNNPNIHKPSVKSSNNLSNALNSKGILFISSKNNVKDSERLIFRNKLGNLNLTSISDTNRINSKFRPKLYMSPI